MNERISREQATGRTGVVLLQLGTPEAPTPGAVRRYLAQFLSDPRVLDMPALGRFLLLHGVILRTRPRRSAAAYQQIWTEAGSPLLLHGQALAQGVGRALGPGFEVVLGMRYGEPSIARAVESLERAGVEQIVALPLFPQYAASSTGSALERLHEEIGSRWNVLPVRTLPDFFDDPRFIDASLAVARPALERFGADHVLFSYHGLPERQVRRSDRTGAHCLADGHCCDAIVAANRWCYRAQCMATTRALAAGLRLDPQAHSTAFQSRLGRTPWIRPFTDEVIPELAERGRRRLAVLCPSFVADCLETLEEIGLRAREQWLEAGGEDLLLVPCVNAAPEWVAGVASMVREAAGDGAKLAEPAAAVEPQGP